jgi:hypothetical protein
MADLVPGDTPLAFDAMVTGGQHRDGSQVTARRPPH